MSYDGLVNLAPVGTKPWRQRWFG